MTTPYRVLFDLVLSKMDPEDAHHLAFRVIRAVPRLGLAPLVRRLTAPHPSLAVTALGLRFDSPFGVAAGFDKDARGIAGLGALGFGHVEVGTITARPQPGNERPRLFRLVPDLAVVNRMGFNNGGAQQAATELASARSASRRPVIGVNIGKSRVVDVDDAVDDYLVSTRLLAPLADYLAVNVSSPNTPGLRGLQELDRLGPLLTEVARAAGSTPVLVKIAPDLDDDGIRRIGELVGELGLAGVIATNTTLSRDGLSTDSVAVEAAGAGGLSGAPLAARSLEVLRLLVAAVPPGTCIVSVGGVTTAADVDERLRAGATLVQGYTAFLYRGPLWARQINRGLRRLRKRP
ncbi:MULTISPECIES: quinone-dependent dihydroorotate dehydrogenase [unclassified Frigoribacterium]|uniref:quinone-dependent dihydroorotate dehydrogenase n=1 Tax=unclassified Frigoribacterium TaxID=2627005 RepID=UPI0007021186|nr:MULTISPECIES: quinone-dependent dihydroorotate dehydrogenase [unclassified Frigoribacterium]KQO82973.1 dihydroorotate dehydrogenase (quinone) [Frigoribacterium sp. Leaf263]KQR64332.1 dihydroorotate dehydrogenase (quinone) [Frigoribacterium sp. Leaf172]